METGIDFISRYTVLPVYRQTLMYMHMYVGYIKLCTYNMDLQYFLLLFLMPLATYASKIINIRT